MAVYNETMVGGGVGGPNSTNNLVAHQSMTGGGLGGGVGLPSLVIVKSMTGGGLGGGTWKGAYFYTGVGGVKVGGTGTAPSLTFSFGRTLSWNDQADFIVSRSFVWNDGEQIKKWYRVTGCCRYPTSLGSVVADTAGRTQPGGCAVLPFQSSDSKCVGALGKNTFIQNIVASNLTEMCEYLTGVGWTWPICGVGVFSQPADNRFATPGCNILQDIPLSVVSALAPCLPLMLEADGTTHMGMTGRVVIDPRAYVGSGGVRVGGNARTSVSGGTTGPNFQYTGSGGVVAGGHAASFYGIDTGHSSGIGMSSGVLDLEVNFSTVDNNGVPLTVETSTVATACVGCSALPLALHLSHNLASAAILNNFCSRNGLTVPPKLVMYYNSRAGAWQSTLHYTGVSDNQSTNESWRVLFDWSCTKTIAGQDLGSDFWRFGISVLRRNLSTGLDLDCRIMVVFPPDMICTDPTGFHFGFALNTQKITVKADHNVVADAAVLYDNIGMFRSPTWVGQPDLVVNMSQNAIADDFIRQDIFSIFPKPTIFGA